MEYITYSQYRNGKRTLKLYHIRHMELVLSLTPAQLTAWIEKHAYRIDEA